MVGTTFTLWILFAIAFVNCHVIRRQYTEASTESIASITTADSIPPTTSIETTAVTATSESTGATTTTENTDATTTSEGAEATAGLESLSSTDIAGSLTQPTPTPDVPSDDDSDATPVANATLVGPYNIKDNISWDGYSLSVKGERLFLVSGEFNYPQLPAPEVWLDIFQQFKANGLNAVSIYFSGPIVSSVTDVDNFETGAQNVQTVLDYAKQTGLYVIARSGPTATTGANEDVLAKWAQRIEPVLERNQINHNGPIILRQTGSATAANESTSTDSELQYLQQLGSSFNFSTIVPLRGDNANSTGSSTAGAQESTGSVIDVYSLDDKSDGDSCTNANVGFRVPRSLYPWFDKAAYTSLMAVDYNAQQLPGWSGSVYNSCESTREPVNPDVHFKNRIGQRATTTNLYLADSGTNYSNTAASKQATHQIQQKLRQIKLINLFTRVAKALLKTDLEGSGTGYTTSSGIHTSVLRNPDNSTRFYVVQHLNSSETLDAGFSISLNTSQGHLTVDNVYLAAQQSKIIPVDFALSQRTLLYSTADILTVGYLDITVLVLYAKAGQNCEFAFTERKAGRSIDLYGADSKVKAGLRRDGIKLGSVIPTYNYTQARGVSAVRFAGPLLVLLLDEETVWKFHAPALTTDPDVKADQHIFVIGPTLVRNATIVGNKVFVYGDAEAEDNSIEVYIGRRAIKSINWNGIDLDSSFSPYGSLLANLTTPPIAIASTPAESLGTPLLNDTVAVGNETCTTVERPACLSLPTNTTTTPMLAPDSTAS